MEKEKSFCMSGAVREKGTWVGTRRKEVPRDFRFEGSESLECEGSGRGVGKDD